MLIDIILYAQYIPKKQADSIITKLKDLYLVGLKNKIPNLNATYYWALQYGELAEIVEPASLRNRIKNGLESMLEKYKIDVMIEDK